MPHRGVSPLCRFLALRSGWHAILWESEIHAESGVDVSSGRMDGGYAVEVSHVLVGQGDEGHVGLDAGGGDGFGQDGGVAGYCSGVSGSDCDVERRRQRGDIRW